MPLTITDVLPLRENDGGSGGGNDREHPGYDRTAWGNGREQAGGTAGNGRWQDPGRLVCPGCGGSVRPEPPGYWRVADGLPAPMWSHADATPLCPGADRRSGETGPASR